MSMREEFPNPLKITEQRTLLPCKTQNCGIFSLSRFLKEQNTNTFLQGMSLEDTLLGGYVYSLLLVFKLGTKMFKDKIPNSSRSENKEVLEVSRKLDFMRLRDTVLLDQDAR